MSAFDPPQTMRPNCGTPVDPPKALLRGKREFPAACGSGACGLSARSWPVGDALLRAERRQAIGRELDSAPVLDGDEALQWPFRAVDAVEQQHEAEPLAFQISSFEHR